MGPSPSILVARPWWPIHWLGIFLATVACLPSSVGLLVGLTDWPPDLFSLSMNTLVAGVTGFLGFRWARLMARLDDDSLVLRGLLHSYRIPRSEIARVRRFRQTRYSTETGYSTVTRIALLNAADERLAVIPNTFDLLRGHQEILRQIERDCGEISRAGEAEPPGSGT